MDRKVVGFTLGILIGLGAVAWWASKPPPPIKETVEETVQEAAARRPRKGPRLPPMTVLKPKEDPDDLPEDHREDILAAPEGAGELDERLHEYLETLDAIDDPDVAELTLLGEMAFDADDAASAYDHYLEVIEEHADDPMAPFALYKFAWSEFNLGDVDAAIDDMELVVEWLDEGDGLSIAASKDLELFRSQVE